MFKLFRRQEAPAPVAPRPKRPSAPTRAPVLHEPPPVGEVKEDHDESAWDLWEQSQFQLDSQLGQLDPSHAITVKDDGTRRKAEQHDPFGSVTKNDK